MKQSLSIIALILVLAAGALALRPLSGSSSAAELGVVTPNVFMAEMEDEICASQSPVHTTTSLTAARADADEGDTLPNVFLVMLEDGVCASLSPISISPRTSAQSGSEKEERMTKQEAALGAKKGVWYIQQ
ncbi:MAG: hypothetical protein IH872_08960 [Chloroflexi bacterium]|nr:hypothetical protein [Chloroflexota bacterium]